MSTLYSQLANAEIEKMRLSLDQVGFDSSLAESAGLPLDRLPKTDDEVKAAEAAINRATEQLSIMERERLTFELHGLDTIDDSIEENPLTLATKLEELQKQLSLIWDKPAYDRAKQLNPDFVQGKEFQLMCLRKERFHPRKAAEYMVVHLEKKQELFGDGEILARDVRLTDLSQESLDLVKSGFVQICPSRDVAGRTIFRHNSSLNRYKVLNNMLRAMWYIVMCAMKDEETQKKGVILLLENYESKVKSFEHMRIVRQAMAALPKRVLGVHFCFSNPALWPIMTGLRLFCSFTPGGLRLRPHFGQPEDLAFEIQTFGIPADCCPKKTPDLAWHQEWLRLQQMKEQSEFKVAAVIVPGRFDVLFGKGKKAREHPGTIRCQYLVELMRDRYEQASRQEKTIVADQIIAAIKESKGRFLKCERGLWVEVEHSVGREKISHWFRHLRSKKSGSSSASTTSGGSSGSMKRPQVAVSMVPNKRPDFVDFA